MFSSLRSRLFVSYLFIILITLIASVLTLVVALRTVRQRLIQAQLRSSLAITTQVVTNQLRRGVTPNQLLDLLRERREQAESPPVRQPGRVILLGAQGQIVADSDPTQSLVGQRVLLPAGEPTMLNRPVVSQVRTTNGRRWYIAAQALPAPAGGDRTVIVATIAPVRLRDAFLGQAAEPILWAGAVALVVSLLLALIIARSVSQPLARITRATEEIAQGNYQQPLLDDPASPEEIRRLAASFSAMTEQVAASQQAQREFVANVSHDLKTPITSIQGFAQALVDGTAHTAEAQQRAAGIIYDEAGRMARLVEQLLDLARLEAGEIVLKREIVDLARLLNGCCERLRPQAAQAGLTLQCRVSGQLLTVGDGDRLIQIFTNLLDNALKATPHGGTITVQANPRAGESPAPTWIDVSITDTGSGIPEEDLPRLFERFYQVDKSRAGRRKGSGLGLAIVRELVEAHGGTIKVESVVGLGSRFIVSLPMQPAQRP